MQVLKTKQFARWAREEALSDSSLCAAVREIESGLHDGDLGGGLFKKRVALPGRGKRGGARTLLAYRQAARAVFVYGFAKNERANIDKTEQAALKRLATEILGYSQAQIDQALSGGAFLEVKCDEDEA